MKFPSDIPVYGDQSFRGPCPRESLEQVTFFNRLARDYPGLYDIAIHPRNEGKRTHSQTARQKSEGMNPGASDIVIPGCPAFVCELKRRDHTKSTWQDGQQEYLTSSASMGAFACVALGADAAMEALKEWLSSHQTKNC